MRPLTGESLGSPPEESNLPTKGQRINPAIMALRWPLPGRTSLVKFRASRVSRWVRALGWSYSPLMAIIVSL